MANFKMLKCVSQSLHSVSFPSSFDCHMLLALEGYMFIRGILICPEAIDKAVVRQAARLTLKSREMSKA